MPLHPQARRLLDAIEALGDPPIEQDTPEAARARRRARIRPLDEPVHQIRELKAGGVPSRLYRPSAEHDLGLLVWLHGGGWVLGDLDTHDNICRALANRSGAAVLSVGYRLAPEHPFPAALSDAVSATRWAHTHASALGCDPCRVAIGGDSAGGNLAAVVAQLQAAPLRFQLLVYPVTDCRRATRSYVENAEGYLLTAAGMAWFIGHYLSGGHGAIDDPRVSPLLADDAVLAGTPPALVITASHDPLRDEGEQYAERLTAAGVPTSLTRYVGQIHGFFSFPDFLDDTHLAWAQAAEAVRRALSAPG